MSYADKHDHAKAFHSDNAGAEWNPNLNSKIDQSSDLSSLFFLYMYRLTEWNTTQKGIILPCSLLPTYRPIWSISGSRLIPSLSTFFHMWHIPNCSPYRSPCLSSMQFQSCLLFKYHRSCSEQVFDIRHTSAEIWGTKWHVRRSVQNVLQYT